MHELKIKEDLRNLIPPLSKEELQGLEASLKVEGCRDKIVVWNGYIIDGHNRYELCKKHGIEFEVLDNTNDLETEADVKLWMINNQFNRRNLPIEARLALAYKFKDIEDEKAKERQLVNLKQFADTEFAVSAPVHTRGGNTSGRSLEAIAKMAGVSARTTDQYDKIQRKGTEEQKEAISNRQASIKKVYNEIQRLERIEKNQATQWPKGKYRVIYADPPWKYGDERSGMGGAVDQYSLMDLDAIKAMPVKDLAEDNAVLFLWAPTPLMVEALEVIEAWGFKYKTQFIWNKCKGNVGNYSSVRHEHLILATKGSCIPDTTERPSSVQTIERTGRHSEKPEEFRSLIEQLYTYGNKMELFARKVVEGWEAYGNEIYDSNDSLTRVA